MDVCCAAGAPVSIGYTPVGSLKELGGVPCYVTTPPAGAATATTGLLAIYDIFGFTSQFKQVCDRIAAAGNYVVVAPDVFRGKPWSLDNFPPQPQDNLIGWISRYSWQDKVKPDVDAVVAALQAQGVTVKGSVGWCWGASQAAHAAAAGGFAATAFLHPSMFGEERQLVRQLRCPLATFSTPGDPCDSMKEAMDATQWGPDCVYVKVPNMIHGYCGARGKFDDPETSQAVGDTLRKLTEFLRKHVK